MNSNSHKAEQLRIGLGCLAALHDSRLAKVDSCRMTVASTDYAFDELSKGAELLIVHA
jgi:hypothetical protein